MRIIVVIAAATLVCFPLSGCFSDGGPIPEDIVSIYGQMGGQKDLRELHLVIERVEVHHEGFAGMEQTYGMDVDLDLDMADARDDLSVFAGEVTIPAGDYNGLSLVFSYAYGVRANGDRVDVELVQKTVRIDRPFATDSDDEVRTLLRLDGGLTKEGNSYTLDNSFDDVLYTVVPDEESGSDVHEVGELVRLPEAFN